MTTAACGPGPLLHQIWDLTLEGLEDTLDLLSDPEAVREIAEAREDVPRWPPFSAEQLRAKYLAR